MAKDPRKEIEFHVDDEELEAVAAFYDALVAKSTVSSVADFLRIRERMKLSDEELETVADDAIDAKFTVSDEVTDEIVEDLEEVGRYNARLSMLVSVYNEKPWQQLEVNESVCVRTSNLKIQQYRIVRVS